MALIGTFAAVLGALFVIGAARDLEFLTDPPKKYAFIYSQSLLRCFFERSVMRWIVAFQGICGLAVGIVFLVKAFFLP